MPKQPTPYSQWVHAPAPKPAYLTVVRRLEKGETFSEAMRLVGRGGFSPWPREHMPLVGAQVPEHVRRWLYANTSLVLELAGVYRG